MLYFLYFFVWLLSLYKGTSHSMTPSKFINFLFLCLCLFACQSMKQLPDGVCGIEKRDDRLIVHLYADKSLGFSFLPCDFDYKTRYGKLKEVEKITSTCNLTDTYDISILAYAAANGDTEYMAYLLNKGFSLKCKVDPDYEPDTPVYLAKHPVELAVRYQHYDALEFLLNHGFKPCCVVFCIEIDNLPMLKLLQSHGAKITDDATSWSDPLICYACSEEMVRYLISLGCSYKKAIARSVEPDSVYTEQETDKLRELIKQSLENK